jgi:hypothetical protein
LIPCSLTTLFFVRCSSFHIVDSTSFMTKEGGSTSIQKLMKVHVNVSPIWPRVGSATPTKPKTKKQKKKKKKKFKIWLLGVGQTTPKDYRMVWPPLYRPVWMIEPTRNQTRVAPTLLPKPPPFCSLGVSESSPSFYFFNFFLIFFSFYYLNFF